MGAYQQFLEFHRANPVVYTRLCDLARQLLRAGYARMGIRLLWERLRWDLLLETADHNSEYKLNDHYKEFYARLIGHQEADLSTFFTKRRSRADQMPEIAA